jgi:hypothetical protein
MRIVRTLDGVRRHYRAAVNSSSTTLRDPHLMPNRHLQRGVLPLAWQLNHPPAYRRNSAALTA